MFKTKLPLLFFSCCILFILILIGTTSEVFATTGCPSSITAVAPSGSGVTRTGSSPNFTFTTVIGNPTFEIDFNSSGGTAPITFTLNSPTLATLTGLGLSFNSSTGELTGTPNATGTWTISVSTSKQGCTSRTITVTLVVNACPTISMGNPTITNPTNCPSAPNNGQIRINSPSGGRSPYTFSINNGGTFQTSNTFTGLSVGTYQLVVKDANGCTSTAVSINLISNTSLSIRCPRDIEVTAPAGQCFATVNNLGNATVSGGCAPINLTNNKPNNNQYPIGTTTVTWTAVDLTGKTVTCTQKVVVKPNLTILPASLADGTVGTAYPTVNFSVQGGSSFIFTYTGTLPAGMTLVNGVLSGTPTEEKDVTITVTATGNPAACTVSKEYEFEVKCPTITVSGAIPNQIVGSVYSSTLSASGSSAGGYVFSVSGGSLPDGLSISGNQVVGTATQTGSFSFTIKATDANGCSGTKAYTVLISCPMITAQGNGTKPLCPGGSDGSLTVSSVNGGAAPYTYSKNGTDFQNSPTFEGLMADDYTITVKDKYNCTTTVLITVPAGTDTTLPTIECAANIEQTAEAGQCSRLIILTAPKTDDNCGVNNASLTFTIGANTYNFSSVTSYEFPVGTTTVTWSITDVNNNTQTCQQTVTVNPNLTMLPASIANGEAGVTNYNINFSVDGGSGFTFTASGVNLPAGVTFSGGVLSGTPTVVGTGFSITVTATFSEKCTVSKTYTFDVTCPEVPVITITPPDLNGNVNAAYSGTFTASGGIGTYTYTLTGTLPTGITFTNGVLSGTTTQKGQFTFKVTATDENGCSKEDEYTLNIQCPIAITLSPASPLTSGVVGTPYSVIFSATGGVAPYTFSAGSLPAGLSLDGATGELSGTPTATFDDDIQISVVDANDCPVGKTYKLKIDCPKIKADGTSTKPSCPGGSNGSFSITTVSGGTADYTFSIDGTTFQSGMTFSGLTAKTYTLTIKDQYGCTGTVEFTVPEGTDEVKPTAVCQNITVELDADGKASITAAQVNDGSSDNCTAVSLSLSQTEFTCENLGTNTVTLTVTDAYGNSSSCTATVTVKDVTVPVKPTLEDVVVQCKAEVTAPITKDACSGEITGTTSDPTTYTEQGTYTITWTFTDESGNFVTATQNVIVKDTEAPKAVCKNIIIYLDANGQATITAAQVDGGSTDNCKIVKWAINNSSFTCDNIGENPVELTVTDIGGNTDKCTAIVTVKDNIAPTAKCAAPFSVKLYENGIASITVADINNGSFDNCSIKDISIDKTTFSCADLGENGVTVTLTVTDVNGNESKCTTTVTVLDEIKPVFTSCPNNIELEAASGQCSAVVEYEMPTAIDNCTPTVKMTGGLASGSEFPVGVTTVTYEATDASGNKATCTFTVTVKSNLTILPATLPNGTAGTPYNQAITVDGGSGFNFTHTGSLPAGMTLMNDGTLSGTPTVIGSFPIKVTATNPNNPNCKTSIIYTLVIDCPVITVAPPSLADVEAQTPFSQAFTATGGIGSYNYSYSGDPIPGLSFSGNTLSGTPTKTGSFTFDIIAKDENGCEGKTTYTLTVKCPNTENFVITANPSSILSTAGIAITPVTFTATGGTGPYTYEITSVIPNMPAGLSFDGTTGILSGTPEETGEFFFTIVATDKNKCSTSTTYAFTIDCPQITVTGEPTAPKCPNEANGSIKVTVTGALDGSVKYSLDEVNYQESNVFENLEAGTYTVYIIAQYGCTGNSPITVVVPEGVDNDKPTIACPLEKIVQVAAQDKCEAIVELFEPATSDKCGIKSLTYTIDGGNTVYKYSENPTNTFSVGVHTIEWTVTDVNGNFSTCKQEVVVEDKQAPILAGLPTETTLSFACDSEVPAAPVVTATDNCDENVEVTFTEEVKDKTCKNSYTLVRTWTAKDKAGNEVAFTQTITVKDNKAPTLAGIPDDATYACASDVPKAAVVTANDNCDTEVEVKFSEETKKGDCPNSFTLTRTWTATDVCGNTVIKSQTIKVEDKEAPMITVCPKDIVIVVEPGETGAVATFGAQATDNCGAPMITYSQESGTTFPVGLTTVTVTSTDACGKTDKCTFTVNVLIRNTITLMPVQEICAGGNTTLTFSTTGIFGMGNTFTAQLSAPNGDFSSPTVLASGISPLTVTVPNSVGSYKVRIVSSDPTKMSNEISLVTKLCLPPCPEGSLGAGTNLVTNGDFEAGATGFTSEYTFGNMYDPKVIAVTNNPNSLHTSFAVCEDHTAGMGKDKMLLVNGAEQPNVKVWCQKVNVIAGKTYTFTAWATTVFPDAPGILKLTVGGIDAGVGINLTADLCKWTQFGGNWTATSTGQVEVCLLTMSTAFTGNDFTIDDIFFGVACTPAVCATNCNTPKYAVATPTYTPGLRKNGTPVPASRADASKALGKPQENDTENFVSLGFGGSIVLPLGTAVTDYNAMGADIFVVETSYGRASQVCVIGSSTTYPETAKVEGSEDGVTWVKLADLCRTGAVDVAPAIKAGMSCVRFLKITDTSDRTQFGATDDGFDVDGLLLCANDVNRAVNDFACAQQLPSCVRARANARGESEDNGFDAEFMNKAPNALIDVEAFIYPNPANNEVTLDIVTDESIKGVNVQIFNTLGMAVTTTEFNTQYGTNRSKLNIAHLSTGVYIIKVTSKEGNFTQTFKVVKE